MKATCPHWSDFSLVCTSSAAKNWALYQSKTVVPAPGTSGPHTPKSKGNGGVCLSSQIITCPKTLPLWPQLLEMPQLSLSLWVHN